jgi:hypothetical protein
MQQVIKHCISLSANAYSNSIIHELSPRLITLKVSHAVQEYRSLRQLFRAEEQTHSTGQGVRSVRRPQVDQR